MDEWKLKSATNKLKTCWIISGRFGRFKKDFHRQQSSKIVPLFNG